MKNLSDREITQTQNKIENAVALAPVRPLLTPEKAAEAWREFVNLKQKLLDDEDYALIAGKRLIRKSGFRKLGVVFNLSDRIIESVRTDREDESFTWRIVVEVQAPNGRICTGVAVCDSNERKFAHLEHDVHATCHTRAKNRAISDMVAGGVVSAEEMELSNTETMTTAPVLDEDGIVDAMKSAGLNAEDLEILSKDGEMVVRPREWLGDTWDRVNSVLWKLGMTWVSAGKDSHWKSGE